MKKPFKKAGRTILATTMALSVLSAPITWKSVSAANSADKHAVQLRILGTSDLHTNIAAYDYYKDAPTLEFGFAKTATLIKQARKEAKNTLLFDNGDAIQGNPLGDYKAKVDKLEEGELHPLYRALRLLGYDAATVGNHEFNYGLDYLDEVLDDVKFPVVNANVYKDDKDNNPNNDKNYFKPYTIINKKVVDNEGKTQVIKVGVIGAVTPQITSWDKSKLEGKVVTKDIVDSVQSFIPQLKKEGADIIVALSHSGIGTEERVMMEENATYDLTKVEGIDAVITGHNHLDFPGDFKTLPGVDTEKGTINGVPVVMPNKFGAKLGVIDLTIVKEKGKWKVQNGQSHLRSIFKTSKVNGKTVYESLAEADRWVNAAIKKDHEGTIDYVRQPVGKTSADIHSYFALVQDDPSIQIVTNAQKWYVEKKVKGTADENLPILSAGAPFKAGGRGGASYYTYIPTGTMAIKNVADLYLYGNTLATVKVKGSDVKEWLEMSAGQFKQIDPSKTSEQALVEDTFPTYNYDVIDGVTYEIDVTQPAKYDKDGKVVNEKAERIKNLQYDGKAIDPNQVFIVVTNDYRANGGTFPGAKNNTEVIMYPDENRQAIIDYIIEKGTIDPSADSNWKFAPISGNVNVVFDSSADAVKAIGENSPIKYVGESANSFAKYSIDLSK